MYENKYISREGKHLIMRHKNVTAIAACSNVNSVRLNSHREGYVPILQTFCTDQLQQ